MVKSLTDAAYVRAEQRRFRPSCERRLDRATREQVPAEQGAPPHLQSTESSVGLGPWVVW